MGDFVFNIAKGAVAEKIRDGANLGIMILRTTSLEADAGLIDRVTVTSLIVTGASREPTNSGYARVTRANAAVSLSVDNANDRVDVDIPTDPSWAAVAAGDGWSKLVIYEDVGGADTSRVPLTAHDFVVTPDGSDITAQIAAGGFYRAS